MQHTEGSFESSDGLKMYYQAWLPEDARRGVVCIVHGIGEHSGRYANVVNVLVPAGFAVYGMDNRGHGRSEGVRGGLPAWAALHTDLGQSLAMVRQAQPDVPLFLMGHSLGGLIVLGYALRHSDGLRGVVASAPSLQSKGISPLLMALARLLSRVTPNLTMKTGLDASAISRDPAVVQAYVNDPLVHALATPRMATESEAEMAWVNARAGQWQLPLLMLHGDADRLVPLEGTRTFFEQAPVEDKTLHVYPGGFHESHNDLHKEQAIGDILAWLEAHL
ncbi:MAG: monoacylglycerol lipase [Anaerolineales bacterium]